MKKLFLSLIFIIFIAYTYATDDKKKENVNGKEDTGKICNTEQKHFKFDESTREDVFCRVECSRTIGSTTFTTKAGNLFMSCEKAEARCDAKLDDIEASLD